MDYQKSTKDELIGRLKELTRELNSQQDLYNKELAQNKLLDAALTERLKELDCHNQISRLMAIPAMTMNDLIAQIVKLLPPSWQFPNFAEAIIVVNHQKFQTSGYKKSKRNQSENIIINDEIVGYVEVGYPDECMPELENPFLNEESDLLFSVATRIGKYAERSNNDLKLQASEKKFRELVESISEIIYEFSTSGEIIYISPSVKKILGYQPEELIGQNIFNILHPEDKPILEQRLKSPEIHASAYHEYRFIDKNGEIRWFRKSTVTVHKRDNQITRVGTLTDISEKKSAEEDLLRSNRLFAVISQVNQAIVYIKEKEKLLEEVCRIAIDFGKFRMVWIGLVDHDQKTISPTVVKGSGGDYLREIKHLPFYDRAEDRGPTEIAAQEGRYFVCNDIEKDPVMAPWKDADINRGYHSSIALPIRQLGKVVAVYNLYSSEINFFNESEIKLLEEVAGDISFALDAIETENERNKAEEETRKFRTINDQANFGSAITTVEGTLLYINPVFARMHQYEVNDLIGKNLSVFHNALQMIKVKKALAQLSKNGEFSALEIWHTRKDGSVFPTLMNCKIIFDSNHHPQYLSATAIEISELYQKEAELRQSEENLNYAQKIGGMGSWEHDFETNILTGSSNYYRQIGLKPGEKVNDLYSHFLSVVHPEDLKIVDQLQAADYSNKKNQIADLRIVLPNGKVCWLQNNVAPIFKDNKLVGLRGVNIDVTERRQAEEEIRKFRTVIEQANYGSAISTLDGTIIYVNKAFAQMHGQEANEVIGKHLKIFHSREQMDRVEETIEMIRQNSSYSAEEVWHTRKDGSEFPTLMSASIVYDAHGIPQYLSATAIDITELKEKETALIHREQELIYAQEIAKMGSWELDLRTGKLDLSKNYFSILGLDPANHINLQEALSQRIHPDDIKRQQQILDEIRQTHEAKSVNYRLIMPDGKTKWIQNNVVPVIEAGELIGIKGVNIDITDKMLAEKEITDQNKRLSAIINALPDLIIVMDKEGTTLEYYTNDQGKLLVPPAQVVGTNIQEIFEPELAALHIKKTNECIDGQKLVTYEYTTRINSQLVSFEARLAPLGPDKALVLSRNITDRKQNEFQIKKLSQAVEQSPVIVVVTNLKGTIEYVNAAFTSVSGYTYEEAIGQNPRILQSGLTDNAVYHNLWNTINSGDQWFGEWINKRKNGEFYWESVSISPILDENGKLSNFLAVKQDITQRKKAEQEIREINANLERLVADRTEELKKTNSTLVQEIEERKSITEALQIKTTELENFFSVALDLLCIADTSGNFIKVNKAWETILGYSVFDLEHRQFLEFVHPDDLQATLDTLSKLSHQQPILNFTNRYRTKDGTFRFIEWRSTPSGNLIYAAARDITERIAAEDRMKRARLEAEQANIAKSEFLSRMSHELRTPMNAILGFAQLLEMGELNPAQRKGVDHILHGGRHLLDLINEVLDISRIESGRLSISPEPVKLNEVLLEMLDTLSPLANSRQISLKLEHSPVNQKFVKADRQRLKQVLLNLINNAIKYNKRGGNVAICAELSTPENIRISIADSGIGIEENDLQKLFHPFERIGAEQTDIEGSGLGLAVVKKLMDAMGGSVGVKSSFGEGSVFWIELPLIESQLENMQNISIDTLKSNREKSGLLLYIEDNVSNIELVEQILVSQRPNIQLVTQTNGKSTLELTLQHKPNLIFLDLNLPDIHGYEILVMLQNNAETRDIPVIILSADAMPRQLTRLLKAGARKYLTKPLDVMEFLYTVDEYL